MNKQFAALARFLPRDCAPESCWKQTVTIAAVNNPAMIELQKLSPKFEAENPGIKLNWVVVEENILRQRITTDVSTGSGQFDLVFLGLYETPIFCEARVAAGDEGHSGALRYRRCF